MGKKKLAILSAFFLTLEAAAAQGGITGPGNSPGIIQLISQIIGVQVTNPTYAIGVAATFGLMVTVVYGILKLGAEKLDVGKSLMGNGRNGGRNILLIVSVLIGLSTLGTGFFGTLVSIYGLTSILLIAVIGLVAAVGVLVFAGSGSGGVVSLASGTGASLSADATKKKAKATKKKAEADKFMDEMKKEAEKIKEDIRGGDDEEAVEIEEDILNKVQELVSKKSNDMEKDIQLAENALEDLEKALQIKDSDEGPKLGYASARINRANAYLKTLNTQVLSTLSDPLNNDYTDLITQTPSGTSGSVDELAMTGSNTALRTDIFNQVESYPSGTGKIQYLKDYSDIGTESFGGIEFNVRDEVVNDLGLSGLGQVDYGICEADEDLDKARRSLKAVVNEVKDEDELEGDAFEKTFDAVEDIKLIHSLVTALHGLLQELEEDDEMLEKVAKKKSWRELFEEVESDEEAVEDLDDYLDHLKDMESKAVSILEDSYDVLSKFLDLDRHEIERLENDKGLLGDIIEITVTDSDSMMSEFEGLRTSGSMSSDQEAALQELEKLCQNIHDNAQEVLGMVNPIENLEERDESRGKELLEELESVAT